jgi:hypothetical protein
MRATWRINTLYDEQRKSFCARGILLSVYKNNISKNFHDNRGIVDSITYARFELERCSPHSKLLQ